MRRAGGPITGRPCSLGPEASFEWIARTPES